LASCRVRHADASLPSRYATQTAAVAMGITGWALAGNQGRSHPPSYVSENSITRRKSGQRKSCRGAPCRISLSDTLDIARRSFSNKSFKIK